MPTLERQLCTQLPARAATTHAHQPSSHPPSIPCEPPDNQRRTGILKSRLSSVLVKTIPSLVSGHPPCACSMQLPAAQTRPTISRVYGAALACMSIRTIYIIGAVSRLHEDSHGHCACIQPLPRYRARFVCGLHEDPRTLRVCGAAALLPPSCT